MLTEGQFLTPRYQIVRRIKAGGMGAVYEGFDLLLKAPVAIKENSLAGEAMRAAFEREAQLLANLRHQSLPRCADLLSVGGSQFLVMDFIEGDDLAAVMAERRGPLPDDEVKELAWQLLNVLEYVHGQSVLHRDVKPANIKLRNGRVYLLDFGLAYGQTDDMETVDISQFNWRCHSPKYSPLEQLRCRRTSPASDIYSLAATLYYLLTNVQPADAETRAECVARGEADPLEEIGVYNPAADEALCRGVMLALSLDARERPQSAGDLRELLFPEEPARPEPRRGRKLFAVKTLSGVLTLGLILFSLFQYFKRLPAPPPKTPPPAEEAARLTDQGERLRLRGEVEAAAGLFEQASALAPDDPYLRSRIGDGAWDEAAEAADLGEKTPEVEEQADAILELTPSPSSEREFVARAWANLAKAHFSRSRPDRARFFEQALADADEALTKHNPDCVAALTIRASARLGKAVGRPDEQTARQILDDYDRAVLLAPDYPQGHANLAQLHFRLWQLNLPLPGVDHLALARSGYEKAVGLSPRAGLYRRLGDVYLKLGDVPNARASFERAVEIEPEYYPASIRLADSFFEEGDWARAETYYLTANGANRNSKTWRGHALRRLGEIYLKLDQPDAAETQYRLALKLDPNDARAQEGLARVRESLHPPADAALAPTPQSGLD